MVYYTESLSGDGMYYILYMAYYTESLSDDGMYSTLYVVHCTESLFDDGMYYILYMVYYTESLSGDGMDSCGEPPYPPCACPTDLDLGGGPARPGWMMREGPAQGWRREHPNSGR